MALHLAARRLGNAAGPQQHHHVHLDLVLLDHCLSDRPGDDFGRDVPAIAPNFRGDDQPLLPVAFHRERGAARRPKCRVTPLDGQLDVLRVNVAAAQDDQVLDPAGDVQLTGMEKPEVAGPEEWAVVV